MAKRKPAPVEKSPTELAIEEILECYPALANQARVLVEMGIGPSLALYNLQCFANSRNYGLVSVYAPRKKSSRPYLRALNPVSWS